MRVRLSTRDQPEPFELDQGIPFCPPRYFFGQCQSVGQHDRSPTGAPALINQHQRQTIRADALGSLQALNPHPRKLHVLPVPFFSLRLALEIGRIDPQPLEVERVSHSLLLPIVIGVVLP